MKRDNTIYYYACRSAPSVSTYWADSYAQAHLYHKAKTWDISFMVQSYINRPEGFYSYPDGNTYFMHTIAWEDFDLLTAFGVSSFGGFDTKYHYPRDWIVS